MFYDTDLSSPLLLLLLLLSQWFYRETDTSIAPLISSSSLSLLSRLRLHDPLPPLSLSLPCAVTNYNYCTTTTNR